MANRIGFQVQNNNPNAKQQAKKKEEDDLKDMTKIFKPVPTAPKLDAGKQKPRHMH